MNFMSWGSGKHRKPAEPAGESAREPAAPGAPDEADFFDDSAEFHICCICGALLGGDLEDELNGEGRGRDICGDCNRTKNDEALFGR
jgi:hypothetical protein